MRPFLGACLVIAIVIAAVTPARAQPSLDAPVVLVAARTLEGPYARAVIWAAPMRGTWNSPSAVNGRHIGVVLNRPLEERLADLYPEHAPSRAVLEPVYFGGMRELDAVFAVLREASAPQGARAYILAPGAWLLFQAAAIDRVIETTPNEARYYAGVVAWLPGQLAAEIKAGALHVLPADPELLFDKDPATMYERLAPKKGQRHASLER